MSEVSMNYREVRARLRRPPNAVPDMGIDLKRRNDSPRLVPEVQSEEIHKPQPLCAVCAQRIAVVTTSQPLAEAAFRPPPPPMIRDIITIVADHYGFRVADLMAQRRTADVMKPRQIAMFLCKDMTGWGYAAIGREFGDRDHSTIMSGIKKIQELRALDPALDAEIRRLAVLIHEARYSAWPAAEEAMQG